MMKPTTISIQNFFGISQASIEPKTPITLICGPNGAGKSSIQNAIRMALTGAPSRVALKKDYPAMMVTTGLHDSQVQYWEPSKWVAKLRDLKTDDNLLIFHINMDYGHGGASGRFQWIEDTALEYAFIFDQLGITE